MKFKNDSDGIFQNNFQTNKPSPYLRSGLQQEHVWAFQIPALMNDWKGGQKLELLAAKSRNSNPAWKMNDEKGQS